MREQAIFNLEIKKKSGSSIFIKIFKLRTSENQIFFFSCIIVFLEDIK